MGLRIAMLGTRGIPAHYGGFETAVEEVGSRLAARGHRVLVYSRNPCPGTPLPARYRGMRVVELPALHRRALETFSHTALSVGHLLERVLPDVALVFNAANSPFLPALRAVGIPVATHVDGLEWRRAKWGGTGRKYYRLAEQAAVRWSDRLIADAAGISDYYRVEFGADTVPIAYGAPVTHPGSDRLAELGLEPGGYHLVVARMEPENHVDLIIEGFVSSGARLPLVVVGGAAYPTDYTRRVEALADSRTRLLGGVWDDALLDQLYGHALTYYHGHSVGGTNPSLLRALGAGAPVAAWDVSFNREVLADAGHYFSTPAQVRDLVEAAEAEPATTTAHGARSRGRATLYDWDEVAVAYERMCLELAEESRTGLRLRRPSGRRSGRWEAR